MYTGIRSSLKSILDIVFFTITLFIALRIILKIFFASPTAPIVTFIYDVSQFFITPFRGIFPDQRLQNSSVLDMTAFVALITYLVASYVLGVFINSLFFRYHDYGTTRHLHSH